MTKHTNQRRNVVRCRCGCGWWAFLVGPVRWDRWGQPMNGVQEYRETWAEALSLAFAAQTNRTQEEK